MIPIEAKSHENSRWNRAHPAPIVVVGLLVVASALSARRIAGAIRLPLPAILLLAAAALWMAVAWTARMGYGKGNSTLGMRLFPADRTRSSAKSLELGAIPWLQWLDSWGMLAATLLAMFALSWPMGRLIDWLVWVPILGAEIWRMHKGPGSPGNLPMDNARRPRTGNRSQASAGVPRAPITSPDHVLQNITRVRDADGDESFYGTLAAEFLPDERTKILHVAFCPPMMVIPDVHAEPSSGPDASVRVTQVVTHGTRIEVRLDAPTTEPVWVTVDFAATGH